MFLLGLIIGLIVGLAIGLAVGYGLAKKKKIAAQIADVAGDASKKVQDASKKV